MTLPLLLVAAGVIFLIGTIVRVLRILRTPAHLRWDLYPIPKGSHEKQLYGGSYFEETEWWTKPRSESRLGELTFVIKEVLFLRAVRENFRALWPWSLALHWGLYLYIVSAAVGIGTKLLHTVPLAGTVTFAFATSCLLGCLGTLGLVITRLTLSRLKAFTTRGTLFNLFFLFAIFSTGAVSTLPRTSSLPFQSAHLVLLALFLVYFPFTHMTHMYMKYFTWHRVRWDDTPSAQDSRIEANLAANLTRTVSWHAAHISEKAPRTWSDVVARQKADEVPHA